ncbi:TetR/AcrR family transcriptional regulator [Mycolicibacterium sp.]|uniref:TetR/AcrR family transcriptional regulator n=1 Tax=Mycolicibacterium sp. TaxID=2320850 RepID=UPI001A3225FB|nr:TetR/AcrR family transcriptional regulator [Mycolicibacterium sp.]MBJ7336886.1 TetR/AcrR family transcriptional regulator C-terminal ligand-binding domain-containing protein [Mycolicibacterium sp.]
MDTTGAAGSSAACQWSAREAEFLAITLELLQQNGYERLTIDAVAATAKASKATVYRRWPSKAELVLAAFIEGIRQTVVPPKTGSLRSDLLALGQAVNEQSGRHASTVGAVLPELSRNPALGDAMKNVFVDQRRAVMTEVLQQAVDRGEIDAAAISDELWDVLGGYLVFRQMVSGTPPSDATVTALVDEVLLPSLTRTIHPTIR